MLAEVVVDGETLHLKDVSVFGRSDRPLTGLTRELLAAREELVAAAREAGFRQLRITGQRVATSTSAHPGKLVDVIIDLGQ